ncbi:MAG: DUF1292 domain-containing protein [Clostridia bacterium]|nr:DUF1292 domain-containing protein [Clostridia bacterium]
MEENQYGSDYFVLTDEDGKEEEFEHLATIDYEGAVYMAMTPADPENESDETEIVIFKVEEDEESGEDILVSVDDDETLDAVFAKFLEMDEEEEDGEEASEEE